MAITDWPRSAAPQHSPGAPAASWRERALRSLGLAYALSGFAIMWAFWVYFAIFLANAPKLRAPWVEPSVDVGASLESPLLAALVDIALIALFGLQHSIMARPRFKAAWAAAIPPPFERATYVHAANAALWLLVLLWQPLPAVIWHTDDAAVRGAVWALFALGWITLLAGALSFGLLELLGVRQMWRWYRGKAQEPPRLETHWLYAWVRHPMYVGVLLACWATPHMTVGHALLAAGLTLYVLIALRHEERDLATAFGEAYRHWRARA